MNNLVKLPTKIRTDLLDSDGENRAVRAFLSMYSNDRSITVGNMAKNLEAMGWGNHPEWTEDRYSDLLTKGGAQQWIRHLFSLEPEPKTADLFWVEGGEETMSRSVIEAISTHADYNGYESIEGDILIIKRAKRINDLEIRVGIDPETEELGYETV